MAYKKKATAKQIADAAKIIAAFRAGRSHAEWLATVNLKLGELKIASGTVQHWTAKNEPKITARSMLPLLLVGGEREHMAREVLDIIAPEFLKAVLL